MEEQAIALADSSGIDLEILRERIAPKLNEQDLTTIKSEICSPFDKLVQDVKPIFEFDDNGEDFKPDIKRKIEPEEVKPELQPIIEPKAELELKPNLINKKIRITSNSISETAKSQDTNYNLRRRRSTRAEKRPPYWCNRTVSSKCYRNLALQCIDVDKYHDNLANRDEHTDKLLSLSNKALRSQIDKFTDASQTPFFIAAWLTSVRVFEYKKDKKFYFEAERLPRRYIDLTSDLITCVHYCDGSLYIAYIGSNSNSYIEIRDLQTSQLVLEPHHYDQTVTGIETDDNFVYIKTMDNIIHLHNRRHFLVQHFLVDLNVITTDAVISLRAQILTNNPYTTLNLDIATTKHFIITKFDALDHFVLHKYNLENHSVSQYSTISAHHFDTMVLLHRNLTKPKETSGNHEPQSIIEVGSYVTKKRTGKMFVHERSLGFVYHIIQVELGHQDNIFVFGRTKAEPKKYEIACMHLADFKPMWCTQVIDVEDSTKILVQEDHLIFIKDRQRHFILPVDLSTENLKKCVTCGVRVTYEESALHDQHPGILRDLRLRLIQSKSNENMLL